MALLSRQLSALKKKRTKAVSAPEVRELIAAGGGSGAVSDGDKGDITVSGSGTVWGIDAGAVTLAKMASLATSTILGRVTGGTGAVEALTPVQVRTLLNVADGATANASDAALRDRSTHTGTQLAATISNFSAAVALVAEVAANTAKVTNATHTGDVTGDTALTIAADAVTNAKMANMATSRIKGRVTAGTGDPEDLTGTQVTTLLDAFTSLLKGLVPASGGGTTTFLRADGTFAAPAGASAVRAGHSLFKPAAGLFIPNAANATALGTQIQVADRTVIAPFVPAYDMTIDQIGISVSTLLAASNAKGVIYAADSNGQPTTILRETPNISCAAAATVFGTIASYTLLAGTTYWIGVRCSGTFTLRTLAVGALAALDYTNAATPVVRQALIKTEAFAGAAVNWTYASSQHSTALMPLILMRIA